MNEQEIVLTAGTFNNIKRMIIDLELRPGEVLMVQNLAQQLGISRTPVREALVRLAVEGLVEHAEGRKFRVAPISVETIREIFEVREALECYSIAEIARRITDVELSDLRTIYSDMIKALEARSFHTFMNLDLRYHTELLGIHKNQTILRILEQMNDRIQRLRYMTISIEGRLERTIDEHGDILNALERGCAEDAAVALKRHINAARKDLEKLFESNGTRVFGMPMNAWN